MSGTINSLPLAEIYVHEVDDANQIDGFIGLNNDYIEGISIKEAAQSKGSGKQLFSETEKLIFVGLKQQRQLYSQVALLLLR